MAKDVTAFPAVSTEQALSQKGTTPAGQAAETEPNAQELSQPDEKGIKIPHNDSLPHRLSHAELMLAYAAEIGSGLKPDVAAIIATAPDAYERNAWTIELAKQFWSAYSQLSAVIKPVTGESLTACTSKDVARTLVRYKKRTIVLTSILIPVSIVMFVNTSISNDINDLTKNNDALVLSLRELQAIPQAAADQKDNSHPPRMMAASCNNSHPGTVFCSDVPYC
jgi:hypothetical protein